MGESKKIKRSQSKFWIGDMVEMEDGQQGEVKSLSFIPDKGWIYYVSSQEVDIQAKKLIDGTAILTQDELKAVK